MASLGSRRGFAEKLSLPLMILAFLVVGGFLYWLNITAEPTEVAIAEEQPEETGPGNAAMMDANTFLASPAQYLNQTVEITGARVSSRLGTQAFWIGPDDRPFMVKMGPQVMEAGTQVLVEQILTIVGQVHMMSDSALAAWDAAGAFPNAGDKIVAEFGVGSPFLEAAALTPQRSGGGGEGAGSGN